MKKTILCLIVGSGLILGTTTLFGQKSFNTIIPILLAEKNANTDVEGTWKISKINGRIVKNELTKTFAKDGLLITKVNGVTKKTKWKLEGGKLCVNEVGDDFSCCEYKVTKSTLTYTIEGMELSFVRK